MRFLRILLYILLSLPIIAVGYLLLMLKYFFPEEKEKSQ